MEAATGSNRLLEGKLALITDGANGIGRTAVDMFVMVGAKVVTSDLDDAGLQEVATEHSDSVVTSRADVAELNDIRAVVALAKSTFGRIDTLYNAGVGMLNDSVLRMHETPYEIFEKHRGSTCGQFSRDARGSPPDAQDR
ncbi:SDR family NAD(P)-dependent oxidoreductase [Arthrobacter sp. GAS37]|uniref:SDR family NAD(P)-dependent oxidoreductase n=1 Tax=Arthrobacter sp. GAS37 TaxID=3156261 RepID=UPI00384B3C67